MYIDDCQHSFLDLAATVLPKYMAQLRDEFKRPLLAAIFSQTGHGVASVARTLGRASDFSGCYVFLDGIQPIYVGISRGVIVRLRQHLMRNDHFGASLAYAMAKKRHRKKLGTRTKAMEDSDFGDAFQLSQVYLQGLTVATVEIENPLELYVFEAYAAMELGTVEWNTFRTH